MNIHSVGIGHNQLRPKGGPSRMYAIVFDLDTQTLEATYPRSEEHTSELQSQ